MDAMSIISAWSYKLLKARLTHTCANCGGAITKGTTYQRNVYKFSVNGLKPTLHNLHFHTNCQTPWQQTADMHLLPHLAQLSPADINRPPSLFVIQRPGLGTLTWQIPAALKSPVAFAGFKVQAEIHQALYLFLSALIMSAGNRKQALRVSSVLHELSDIVNNP